MPIPQKYKFFGYLCDMKKIIFIAACLAAAFLAVPSDACTNVIISKGASANGSVLVSYAADSHMLFGELYFHKAARWKAGSMLSVDEWDTGRHLNEIPQPAQTWKTVGNMNEHQLIIGETTYGGREELMQEDGLIDYGSLIYITLQRARTAREAIETIVSLADTYGYCSEGETFSIADREEAWVMDLIGRGDAGKGIVYVAMRLPDGAICAHANQARIGRFPLNDPENCLYAPDVISLARSKGWFDGADEEFSFRDAYCPADFGTVRGCDARAWSAFNILTGGEFRYLNESGEMVTRPASDYIQYAMGHDMANPFPLFVFPAEKVTVKQVADVMRDHYEGTPMDMTTDIGAGGNALPYRWRPMEWEIDGKTYLNERAIATQQTGFWFVAEARGWLPEEVGGIFWFGTDDAATSYITPIYTASNEVPECFREGNGDILHYSPTASFWINNRISNACYKAYNIMAPTVVEAINAFENEQIFHATRQVDSTAVAMLSRYRNHSRAVRKIGRYLTKYTVETAQKQFGEWVKLEELLLVKYIDGNVKDQNPDGSFITSETSSRMPAKIGWPGYTDHWKRSVAADHGSVILVP